MIIHSLKKQLLLSHNKVSVLANLCLIVAALVAMPLYLHTQSLTNIIFPDTIEVNELKNAISRSEVLLNTWLITGDTLYKQARHNLWKTDIDPIISRLSQFKNKGEVVDSKLNIFVKIKKDIVTLKSNQLKIEDCSSCTTYDVFYKNNDYWKDLYIKNIKLNKNIGSSLAALVERENLKMKNILRIISGCLILFFVVSIACMVLFNMYTFLIVKSTANHYLSRLRQLISAATSLSESRPQPLVPKGNDEIAQLMHEFNIMQDAIRSREHELKLQRDDINQLTRVVTHDMKSPIINIKGHAEIIAENGDLLLKNNKVDVNSVKSIGTIKKSIGYIKHSTIRIDELITGILTYSTLSDKKIVSEKIIIIDIIQEVLNVNQHRLASANVTIFDESPDIIFNDFALKFIISTLIDNAIAYQDKTRPLQISIDYSEEACSHKIFVKDNGVGLDQHQIDNLFQLSNKASTTGGFGVGLATAKMLARRANGDVSYQNRDNSVGAVFVITLLI